MEEKEKLRLRKLLKELREIKGRHTELVSVYIPAGFNLVEIINQLTEEKSTAMNIKSKTTRKNVLDALEKIISHLKLFKQTPPNGLVVFCGNVSKVEGKSDIRLWSIEPPEKLSTKLYWCDQVFVLEPLEEMVREKEVYGLIVLDAREANIGLLKGKAIEPLKHLESTVPSKSVKGGMCIHPDTLIPLQDGRILKAKELKEKDNPLLSFNPSNFKVVKSFHTNIFTSKVKKFFEIETVFPKLSIKVSPNHRFVVCTDKGIEFIKALSLKKGDYLLTVKKLPFKKSKKFYLQPPILCEVPRSGCELIRKRRKEAKLTQKELAKKIGIHRKTYEKFEKFGMKLKEDKLKILLETLRIETNKFYKKYVKRRYLLSVPKFLNEKFCELLGYMLGDGSVDYGKIVLYDKDKKLLIYYKSSIKSLFKLNSSLHRRERKNYFELNIYSRHLIKLINTYFPGILGNKKTIPLTIHTLSKPLLAAFIKGLYDAEGWVNPYYKGVEIGMSNENVIRVLQILLLRFGIITSYIHENNKYKLQILDLDSLKNFSKWIGFNSKEKNGKLNKILKVKKRSKKLMLVPVTGKFILTLARSVRMSTKDFKTTHNFFVNKERKTISTFKKRILRKFYERMKELKSPANSLKRLIKIIRISRREIAELVGCSPYQVIQAERGNCNEQITRNIWKRLKLIRKELITKCCQILKFLRNVADGDVILTKIKKITVNNTFQEFYDISVPKFENFIANCIVVHNSQRRYDRIREDALNEFLKKVGEVASKIFLEQPTLKGIIIGGPGPTKFSFAEGKYLHYQLVTKVLGVKDVGDTSEYGLEELVNRSEDLLREASVAKEKALLNKFFIEIQRGGKVSYKFEEIENALNIGAVDTLLISDAFDLIKAKLECDCGEKEVRMERSLLAQQICKKCGKK
jgi:peptide subunit release factor 1 (eRF1)/transcriptional regulator with XRE-family HTH domain